MPSNTTPRYMPKRNKRHMSRQNFYTNVHSDISHNSLPSPPKTKQQSKCLSSDE